MCGICGQFNFGSGEPASRDVVRRMTGCMVHRGPDDEGYFLSGPVGLGFRRLSIIDIAGGHQPMADRTGRVQVVFNGEIYNFRELRTTLEARGHTFLTRSDTEVIVEGYREWGVDVLQRLNGMFGLAIWDEVERRLLVARDPMGIKLIYFTLEAGRLRFASEIRPLLAVAEARPSPDPTALYLFLRYRYTPSPLTSFKGIRKLAPGTCLIAQNGTCHIKRWWTFAPEVRQGPVDADEARDELLEIYRRVVRRQLVSDVPVGLLLSGGVDSGLLLALMSDYGGSWNTFTVGYGDSFKDDELKQAKDVAALFGARHSAVMIDRRQFEESLPRIISQLEEPIASSSVVPMYYVCKLASLNVKVALVGQGPDELFGGYTRHLGARYGEYWRSIPRPIRALAKSGLSRLARNETVMRALYSLDEPDRMTRYQQIFSLLPGEQIGFLFHEGLIDGSTGDVIRDCWRDLEPLMTGTDELGGLQFLEVRSSLPDELLMYADKLSMAHSLELRVPFLDQEIVEFVECLPARLKVRNGARKWIHKRACASYLPREVVRRKKRGFAVNVVDEWFAGSVLGKMNGILNDPKSLVYDYLVQDRVLRLLADHRAGRYNNHKVLFSIVVFEEWLRNFAARAA